MHADTCIGACLCTRRYEGMPEQGDCIMYWGTSEQGDVGDCLPGARPARYLSINYLDTDRLLCLPPSVSTAFCVYRLACSP